MARITRLALAAVGLLVVLILVVAVCVPLFLNADSFRNRIEATLTNSLGRKVTIGKLSLSVWSGGLLASNVAVADDPAFSQQPFIQADSLKIGVELVPLIFSKQLHIRGFTLVSPRVQLLRAANAKWNYSSLGKNSPSTAKSAHETVPDVTANEIAVTGGSVTLTTPGAPPLTYSQVDVQIDNFGFRSTFPYTLSAQLPGGGSLSAKGQAGPLQEADMAATPFSTQVSLKRVNLASAGVLPADAGVGGVADIETNAQSNGQTLNATGTATIDGLRLAKDGQPSAKPLTVQFTVAQNEQSLTGQLQKATFTIGKAVVQASGTYQTTGATTTLNLKVNGEEMPIDELVAFLPSAGVHLPRGSQLRGGTLSTTLAVTGASASPVISGPVRLSNTQLAGFDLGSKLQTLSQLTGGKLGSATGPGTNIRSLTMNVRETGGAIQTDNIALDVAGVGTATGDGTVSAAGALNYRVTLRLTGIVAGGKAAAPTSGGTAGLLGGLAGLIPGGAGSAAGVGAIAGVAMKNGIPVAIGGTTSSPTFTPNLGSLAASAGKTLLKGTSGSGNSLGNALGGLLGRH